MGIESALKCSRLPNVSRGLPPGVIAVVQSPDCSLVQIKRGKVKKKQAQERESTGLAALSRALRKFLGRGLQAEKGEKGFARQISLETALV